MDKITAWLEEREPRERVMLLGMAAFFLIMIPAIFLIEVSSSFAEKRDNIDQMRTALDTLHSQRGAYLVAKERKATFEAKIQETTFQPTSIITSKATENGLKANVIERGTKAASADDSITGFEQLDLEVRIENANHDDFMLFLSQLTSADVPMYVKRIDIRRGGRGGRRRGSSAASKNAPLDVTLLVGTFRVDDGTDSNN